MSTDGTAMVAGRTAYELVLQPKDAGSLVESVHIAIDGKTHVPTRVQVFAKNAEQPRLRGGLHLLRPDHTGPSVFTFNPPPGTKVTEGSAQAARGASPRHRRVTPARSHGGRRRQAEDRRHRAGPRSSSPSCPPADGSKAPSGSGQLADDAQGPARGQRHAGARDTCCGARLFSALLTDDGRVAVGAVAPEALYAALAS